MHRKFLRHASFVLLAAPLLLAACASEGNRTAATDAAAMNAADQSKAEAEKALNTAQQALQTAQKAEQEAMAADQRAATMYNRSLKK